MRVVHNEALLTMASPIRFVMNHIHHALINIAPERKEDFDREYGAFEIVYIDSPTWYCSVAIESSTIYISRKVVEIAWCAACAYYSIYEEVRKERALSRRTVIELRGNPLLASAVASLKWSLETWIKGERDSEWPQGASIPVESPEAHTLENVADELCLCAIAFFLHHELAHLHFHHDKSGVSIEQEREADKYAVDWILNNTIPIDDPRFVKRALGVAVGFLIMTADSIHSGNHGGISHPKSYDRLLSAFREHIQDRDHVVWSFIAVILKLHLDNAGYALPEKTYPDFMAAVEAYIQILSTEPGDAK